MRLRKFGDDIVIKVEENEKKKLDIIVMLNKLKEIGKEENKEEKVRENERCLGDKKEVNLMKRKLSKVNKRIICNIYKKDIEEVFGWKKMKEKDVEIWEEIVEYNIMEENMWGKE
jgi:hypothetical protein